MYDKVSKQVSNSGKSKVKVNVDLYSALSWSHL